MPTDKELAELFGIDPSLEQRPTLSQQRALVSSGSFQAPYTASQEAFPTIPEMSVQNVLGYNQGTGAKLGNGLAKMGVTALSSGVENTIGLFNGIGQMVTNAVDNDPNTSITEGLWNNATGRSVDAINEWARDAFPTYYTEAQEKMGLESMLPGSGNAINWWSDKFLGGAGYMLGAVGSGMLASGLLRGASNATVKGLLKKELAGAVKDATGTTSASLLEKGGLGIVMAHGESSVEARDIKKNTYDSLLAQGIDPVEAEKISSAAGNVGYAINMALVGGTDISMFGKSLLGWRGLKQKNKYLATEAGQAVAKTPGKIDKYLPAIEGFGKEFSQEVGQLGTQKGVEDFYLRQHEMSSLGDFFEVIGNVVGESIKSLGTNEGWEAGLLGGFLGGPAGAIQSRGATDEEYKRAQIAADVINTGFKNIQNTKDNILQAAVSGKMAEQALQNGDKERFYDNKSDEFKGYVKAVEKNGGTDVLISQMESMKNAPTEKVRQFFQIPAGYDFNDNVKNTKINEAINEIKQIAETHRKIQENYPTLTKPVFDALFDAATSLNNTSKRVGELSGELSVLSSGELTFSELDYKNDVDYRNKFNREAKAVIDKYKQISPSGADEIIEKMKALKYLTLERRQKYIKQWEQATEHPEEIVKQAEAVATKTTQEPPVQVLPVNTEDPKANERNKLNNNILAEETGLNSEEKLAAAKQKLIDIDAYGVLLNQAFPQEAEQNKKEEEKLKKVIQDRIKNYENKINELKYSDKYILHGASRIGSIFNFRLKRDAEGKIIGEEWLTPIDDLVAISNIKWQDINSKTTLSYEEYNVPGETPGAIKRLADTDMFPEDYPAGIRTGIKVGDKYYSIAMQVNGIQYGWLLDPDRFQFKNSNPVGNKEDIERRRQEELDNYVTKTKKEEDYTREDVETFMKETDAKLKRGEITQEKRDEIKGIIQGLVNSDETAKQYIRPLELATELAKAEKEINAKYDAELAKAEEYSSFNPNSTDHLAMLNPGFVTTDGQGKVVPSALGLEYIREYKNLMNAFSVLREKIANGETISLLDIQDYANLIPQDYFFASEPEEAVKFLEKREGKFTTEFNGRTFGPLVLDRRNDVFFEFKEGKFVEIDKETSQNLLEQFERHPSVKRQLDKLTNNYLAVLGNDGAKNPVILTLKYKKLSEVKDLSKDVITALDKVTKDPNIDIQQITKDKGIFIAGNLNKDTFGAPVSLNLEVKATKGGKPKFVLNVYSVKSPIGIPSGDIVLNQPSEKYPYIKTEGETLTYVKGKTETPITNSQELIDAINTITENWVRSSKYKADNNLKLSKSDQLISTLFIKELGETSPLKITSLGQRPESNSQNLAGATIDNQLITTLNLRGKSELVDSKTEPAVPLSDFFEEPSATEPVTPSFTSEAFGEAPAETSTDPIATQATADFGDVFGIFTPQNTSNNSNDDSTAFKLSEEIGEDRNLIEAIKELSDILDIQTEENPDGKISVKEFDEINKNVRAKGYSWGRLIGNVIELSKKRGKGVEFHEAFHAIFRIFLSKAEIQQAYKDARKKYGEPKELDEFRAEHPSRYNLSKSDLELLWLEEQMADDYQSSKLEKKGVFQKIFDKLKKLVSSIFNSVNSIDSLFDKINSGYYKTANPRTDVVYFPGQAFKLIKDSNGKYLDPSLNERVIGKVLTEALKIKVTKGFLEPSDMKEIASRLNVTYYNAKTFKDAIIRLKEGIPGVQEADPIGAQAKAREIIRIQLALKSEENQALLYEEINERIATTGFPVEDIDTSDEEDKPMEMAAKDTSEKGGWGGLSTRIREWLSSIRVPSDDFELNLTDAELANPVHQNFVNPYQLYNALDRSLVNTRREDILPRFEIVSRTNKTLRAAYNRLVKDVSEDLEVPLDNATILEQDFQTLSGSSTFNMFVSNFNTMRADRIKPLIDPESNKSKIIRSNINDIQDIQVNDWKGNWFYKNLDNKLSVVESKLSAITKDFNKVLSFYNPLQQLEIIKNIKKNFEDIGISLDDSYIKYSFVNNTLADKGAVEQLQDNELFQQLVKDLELFPEVDWIGSDLLKGLSESIKAGGFYKSSEEAAEKGAESRLKKIALGNSVFDESVVPVTVRNIEGKIVYLNLKPNYYLYESFLWRDGNRVAAFKQGTLQAAFNSDGNYMSDWQFELYNQALKYNHWLNAENAETIMKNFRMFVAEGLSKTHLDNELNVEEFRESIEKTYTDTDQASTYLIMLNQFSKSIPERVVNNFRITDNKQEFAPFMLVQTEGKNTQYPVLAPVNSYNEGLKLNQKALDILSNYMEQEFERIQNVKKGLKVKIEKVNLSEKDRGYDYFNFKSIKGIDEAAYAELKETWNKEKAQELIEKDINQKFQDFLAELKKTKLITEENTTTILPDYFRNVDKVQEDALFNFWINQYVNSLAFNNLMFGDSALNFKSFLDEVKRMGGPNANGPSLGSAATTVDVIKDSKKKSVFNGKEVNTTDAQSYATPEWFLTKYLKGLGKSNKEVDKILKKVIRGYVLSAKEVDILNKNASLINSKKTALFNQNIYGKTSTHVLLRSITSEAIDRKELDRLYDLIDANQSYPGIHDDINKLWSAVPGREELHEQLNNMYSKGVELRFRESAVKTQTVLNTPFIVSDNYIREQMVTDGLKDEIKSGVQYIQLITGEQGDGEATVGKAKVSFKNLALQYENLLGIKQSKTYKLFQKLLFPHGNFSEKYISKLFEKSLNKNAQDILLKTFLVSDHTGFKHNINRLTTLKKAENIFNSIVSSVTFRQLNAGHKLTLVSDEGYGVIRDAEGKVIPANKLKQGFTGKKDRLSYKFDAEKNVWYAEAIISAQLASQLGYTTGKAFEFVGVRIPTQDKHSMINLRVVDVLPAETGNCCILPHEIIELAGLDFDIDSEFLNGASYYEKANALGFFGDYYTTEKKYEQAFEEYLEGAKIYDGRFILDYKDGLKANEEYKKIQSKLLELGVDLSVYKSMYTNWDDGYQKTSAESKLISQIFTPATELEIENLKKKKQAIQEKTSELVLKGLGYKTDFEEFKEKYTSQIDKNISHFNKGEFDKIQALSVGELNNNLWEISKYLVMNKDNEQVAQTSATRFIADDFRDKYFKTGIFKDPGALKDINSAQSIVKAKWLNSVGEVGIGIPALSNIAFNYLVKADVEGYTKYVNSEGQRINDINSAFVSIFVDAANENDPVYLNLTGDNTGAVLNAMQRGMNAERALLLNIQPAMIELINNLDADTGQIFKKQGFDILSKNILEKYKGGKQIELSDENLVKAKVAFETNNFDTISKEEYNFIQYAAIENFLADREEAELVRNLNPIISLAKGVKPTFAEMSQIDKAIKALGLVNENGKAKLGKKLVSDTYKAVLHSNFLTNLVEDYWKFKKDSANLFIVQSEFANKVVEEVKELVKDSKVGNEEFNSKLNLALVSFLQTKKLQMMNKGMNVSDILTLDKDVKPLYIQQFEQLKKDEYFGKNKFIKSLKYTPVPFTKGALAGKFLHKLTMPSRIRKDAYYQGQMMNSVEELFKPDNVSEETAALAKDFIKNLLRITTGKDAGLFKNESFSEFVRPDLTQSVDRALNEVVDILQKEGDYTKAFGLTKEELINEAVDTIARDYSLQDMFQTANLSQIGLKKVENGLSGTMNFVPPRFIYNFADVYRRNTYSVEKSESGVTFPVTYTKTFTIGHKDINAAAFPLNTWKMINDTKAAVKKVEPIQKVENKQTKEQINFLEEQTPGYKERTIRNASADATIAMAVDFNSAGEKLTKSSVLNQNKKYIPLNANNLTVTKERVDKIVEELNSINKKSSSVASIPQNLVSGVESFGTTQEATQEVKRILGNSPHSIDMIEAGVRTRTTRSVGEMEKYNIKVGDIVKQFGKSADGTTKTILTRITAIHPKGSPEFLNTWEKEGWTTDGVKAIKRFKDGAAAIEFEIVKPSITLNIAGNGIYTMKGKYTQQQVDDFTYDLLKAVVESPNLKNKIELLRTGGQTGFDEAGAKAAQRLGIKTLVLAPKGWVFRDITGKDISSEEQFKSRFQKFIPEQGNLFELSAEDVKNIEEGKLPEINKCKE